MITTETVEFDSQGNFYTTNVTERVREVVLRAEVKEGSVLVFYRHTTGGLMAAEHEVGLLVDLEDVLSAIAPIDGEWAHHRRGFDRNGGAHVRTAFLSPSITIPISQKAMLLGTYQEILVVDFDPTTEPRRRKLVVQVAGE